MTDQEYLAARAKLDQLNGKFRAAIDDAALTERERMLRMDAIRAELAAWRGEEHRPERRGLSRTGSKT